MLDQLDSMELDESRTPLNRSLGPGALPQPAAQRGGANTSDPPGTDDANYYPRLPSTLEKPPTTRQRRAAHADEPDTADVEARLALHALTEPEPKPKPRARRDPSASVTTTLMLRP